VVPKRIYIPKIKSAYIEEEVIPDSVSGLDVLFQEHGNVMYRKTKKVAFRDKTIIYDESPNTKKLCKQAYNGQIAPRTQTGYHKNPRRRLGCL
jgi:hypothetical protein